MAVVQATRFPRSKVRPISFRVIRFKFVTAKCPNLDRAGRQVAELTFVGRMLAREMLFQWSNAVFIGPYPHPRSRPLRPRGLCSPHRCPLYLYMQIYRYIYMSLWLSLSQSRLRFPPQIPYYTEFHGISLEQVITITFWKLIMRSQIENYRCIVSRCTVVCRRFECNVFERVSCGTR